MARPTGMDLLADSVREKLRALDARNRRRRLRPIPPSTDIDLTHNDYLGLRADAAFQARARTRAEPWPAGAGASRLLGGEHPLYAELEAQFAAWIGAPGALYFGSGYAANEALMAALHHDDTVFFSDEYNHASLIDGMRLARLQPAQRQIFPHNDLARLEAMIRACPARLKIVVTETLFSMDGDFCEAGAIHALCQRTGALLVVDEAHAIGAYGPHGRGWMAAHGLAPESFIAVYPCGKAMAGAGAFVCAPAWLRDYLVNTARSFIYTTGPSPWVAAALCESIDTVRALDAGRAHLRSLVATVRAGLLELGFDLGRGDSHIVPVILGSEQSALAAEAFCLERNLHARAIRPPTVPEHGSRLRLSLHAGLSQGDAERVLGTFGELAAACKR